MNTHTAMEENKKMSARPGAMEENKKMPARPGANTNQEEEDLRGAILASIDGTDAKQNPSQPTNPKVREVDLASCTLRTRQAHASLTKSIGEQRNGGAQRRSRLEEMKQRAVNIQYNNNEEEAAAAVSENNSTAQDHHEVASLHHPHTNGSTFAVKNDMEDVVDDVYQDEDEHYDVEDSKPPPAVAAAAAVATFKPADHSMMSRETKEMRKLHQFEHRRVITDIEAAILYTFMGQDADVHPGAVAMPGIGVAPTTETPDNLNDGRSNDEEEEGYEPVVVTPVSSTSNDPYDPSSAVDAVVVSDVMPLIEELRPKLVVPEPEVFPNTEVQATRKRHVCFWSTASFLVILAIAVSVGVTQGRSKRDDGSKGLNATRTDPDDNETKIDRFTAREDLEAAIDAYMDDNGNDTAVARARGWPIGEWDVSGVEYFNQVFSADRNPKLATFNEPIDKWNTGRSRSFFEMFKGAAAFNQNVSFWDMSNAREVQYMFQNAESFNQPMSSWDVSQVTDMTGMLLGTSAFNQDISSWKVSRVTSMASLFSQASSFNQNISGWDVSRVTHFNGMFNDASSFNQNLNSWDVSRATTMEEMFSHAREFNGDVSSWNVSQVSIMHEMFFQAFAFNQDVSNWDVRKVTTMRSLFQDASVFNQDLSNWKVSRVTDMAFMFWKAEEFDQDLSAWDVSQVISMKRMFAETLKFNRPLSSWKVNNAVDVSFMFQGSKAFNQDLQSWNVSNVADFSGMFLDATTFNHDLCTWGNLITNMSAVVAEMFDNTTCPSPLNVSLVVEPKGPFCFECHGDTNTTR